MSQQATPSFFQRNVNDNTKGNVSYTVQAAIQPRKRSSTAMLSASPCFFQPDKQHALLPTPVVSKYYKEFHGYKCMFIPKVEQDVLMVSASQMLLTKTYDSVCLFRFSTEQAKLCFERVDNLLEEMRDSNQVKVNPFRRNIMAEETLFAKLNSECMFYEKRDERSSATLCSKPALGKVFNGRVAIIIKGAKISPKGEISPMMSVVQVLVLAEPSDIAADEVMQRCVLDI